MRIPPFHRPAVLGVACLLAGLAMYPAFSRPAPEVPKIKTPPGLKLPEDKDQPRPVTLDQVPLGALVPQGPAPAVTVLATGDVVGYLEPCG